MPCFNEELTRFKTICRHIMRHETDADQAPWFRIDQRYNLKRLSRLGVEGNQPAIAAFVDMTKHEREVVARSIFMQKIGHNNKAMKQYDEHQKRVSEAAEANQTTGDDGNDQREAKDNSMLIKINRVATRTAIRWKRITKESTEPTQSNHSTSADGRPTYTSRILPCSRCGNPKETSRMQLRTKLGYRAIHCRACGLQEVCSRSWCQCNIIWHQCTIHRIDPGVHASRKGLKKEKKLEDNPKHEVQASSKRKAPISRKEPHKQSTMRKKRRHNKHDSQYTRHVKFVISKSKPSAAMIERLKVRINEKAEQLKQRIEIRKLNVERERPEGVEPRHGMEARPRQQPTRKELTRSLKVEAARQRQVREVKIAQNKNSDVIPCTLARSMRTYRGEDTDKFLLGIGGKKGKACERNAILRLLKS